MEAKRLTSYKQIFIQIQDYNTLYNGSQSRSVDVFGDTPPREYFVQMPNIYYSTTFTKVYHLLILLHFEVIKFIMLVLNNTH